MNCNRCVHSFVTTHTSNSILFVSHGKQMVIFFLITSIFLFIYITNNNFLLQAIVLGCEPSPMDLFMETHLRIDDCQKRMQQLMDSRVHHLLVCCCSNLFLTTNTWLEKKYGDDPSTHSDLNLDL